LKRLKEAQAMKKKRHTSRTRRAAKKITPLAPSVNGTPQPAPVIPDQTLAPSVNGTPQPAPVIPDQTIFDNLHFSSSPNAERDRRILDLRNDSRSYTAIVLDLVEEYPTLTREAVIKIIKRQPMQITEVIDWNKRTITIHRYPKTR
jgi:hypothetical protein